MHITSKMHIMAFIKMDIAVKKARDNTSNIWLVDSKHMNYAINTAALFSASHHYSVVIYNRGRTATDPLK